MPVIKEPIKRTPGELLKANGAIMNYIHNNLGNRIGVVVATKGCGKGHPSIGWALFEEVDTVSKPILKLKDIPNAKDMIDQTFSYFKLKEQIKFDSITNEYSGPHASEISVIDTKLDSLYESLLNQDIVCSPISISGCNWSDNPADRDAKYNLFKLALERGNYDSWHYYIDNKDQAHSDLREDNLICTLFNYNGDPNSADYEITEDYDSYTAAAVRKAIRAMEYRCWKYFK